jgi:CheY-like chemotaxis protein
VIDAPSAEIPPIQAIDALACVAALRASPETRHVRIVVTSADEGARDRAMAAGAASFVRKSTTTKLREVLEEMTGLTR